MGNRRHIKWLAASLILARAVLHSNAQEQTTSPTLTQSVSMSDGASGTLSISGSGSGTGSEPPPTDVPIELWGIANSLLSTYYPSTTISNVASLTWPSVVVIGSSTYTRDPPTTSPSTLATSSSSSQDVSQPETSDISTSTSIAGDAEPSETPEEPAAASQPRDRTLGIALGVVFGVLALGLMVFALLCVHRRQKKHGGIGLFPSRRRRVGSPTDSEVGAWRARHPHMGLVAATVTTATGPMSQVGRNDSSNNRPPREWVERYNRLEDQQTPPAHLHPAFMHHRHNDSVGTMSESNSFFLPAERDQPQRQDAGLVRYNEQNEYHPGYPKSKPGFNVTTAPYRSEEDETRRSQSNGMRRSSSFSSGRRSEDDEYDDVDLERNSRPPTPFSPMMMLQTSLPPFQQNPQQQTYLNSQAQPRPQDRPRSPQQQNQPHPSSNRYSNPFTSTEDTYASEEIREEEQQHQHPSHQTHQPQNQQHQQTQPLLPHQPQPPIPIHRPKPSHVHVHTTSHSHPTYQPLDNGNDEDDNDLASPMLQSHPQHQNHPQYQNPPHHHNQHPQYQQQTYPPLKPQQHPQHPQHPPPKSPARRYSPIVHYPSWSEVSEFDFTPTGESSGNRRDRRRSRGAGPGDDGYGHEDEDGYGRGRESVVGRTELA